MWFLDQAQILVTAGAGGDGCRALFKQPFSRYPRPSGGNGGDGGDVLLVADPHLATLLDFHFRHEFRADRGRHGRGNNKTGKRGADRLIRVPVGTVVYDQGTGRLLRDLVTPGEPFAVALGGIGGLGNATRSTSLRVASRAESRDANASQASPGTVGEERRLRLELKLIADVGLVGFPNAGKSSLLSRVSTAHPKIAPYPFTTKTPVLGVVSVGEFGSFVCCDIPGLIEGAHQGKGLGFQFLRHIERTKLLVHVIDMAGVDGRDPVASYHQLNQELELYNPVLRQRPQIVAANKMDMPQAQESLRRFQEQVQVPLVPISCATTAGIADLVQATWQELQTINSTPRLP